MTNKIIHIVFSSVLGKYTISNNKDSIKIKKVVILNIIRGVTSSIKWCQPVRSKITIVIKKAAKINNKKFKNFFIEITFYIFIILNYIIIIS